MTTENGGNSKKNNNNDESNKKIGISEFLSENPINLFSLKTH